MSAAIRIGGPDVDDVTPEQIAEALDEFSMRYLCHPLAGPYPGVDDRAYCGVMWALRVLYEQFDPDPFIRESELHQLARDMLAYSPEPAES